VEVVQFQCVFINVKIIQLSFLCKTYKTLLFSISCQVWDAYFKQPPMLVCTYILSTKCMYLEVFIFYASMPSIQKGQECSKYKSTCHLAFNFEHHVSVNVHIAWHLFCTQPCTHAYLEYIAYIWIYIFIHKYRIRVLYIQ
jgi:hypothetical protein